MRWAPIVEKPEKNGQYYVWHERMGKVVMGYVDGSWGGEPPTFWLQSDQCKNQAVDGSFADVLASKAYPIEDEL